MTLRGLNVMAVLVFALGLAGCGAGSGRSGTDLAVTGAVSTPDLLGGDAVSFVMTVRNRGDFEATDVVIRNATLQVAQSGLTISCTAAGGAVCPVEAGASMEVPRLPAGGSLVFEVRSTVNTGASGTFSNTMVVSSDTADINSDNNAATVSGTVRSHDIDVSATAPAGPLVVAAADFTLVVANAGPDTATDVVLTTTVSDNLVFVPADISCEAQGGAQPPTLQADGSLLAASIPAAGQLVCAVPVTVVAGTNGIAVVSMTSASAGDSRTGNDSATASVSATLVNDVSVVATAPAGPLVEGPATFTLVVANAGPAAAQDVSLATTTSANLSLLPGAISCSTQGGAVAPTLQADGSLLSPVVPSGGQLNCSVPVTVSPGTSGVAVVSMTATAAADVRAGNNTATASVSATLVSDLNVAGSAAAPSVPGGASTRFTLVVNNSGPATAYDVVLGNTLSTGLSLSGAITCTAAGGATEPVTNVEGQLVAAALPVGGVLTCTVPVTVEAGASGVVFTSFSANALGETRPVDNSATVTTVAVSSNLGVSQTGAEQAAAGGRVSFVARVANPGPSAASNVNITWTTNAPAGVEFETPTCTGLAGAVCPTMLGPTMSVPTLEPGRTLVFNFEASTVATFRGDVVNAVAVTSTEDTDLSNNSASSTTTVVDPRSGSYQAYAADGRRYDLVVDFDGLSYLISGNGVSASRSFSAAGGGFTVAGNVRFRAATDMLVGSHDFADGVLPYIAVRDFAGGLPALAGSYNLATRIIAADGTARSLPGTAFITGNTLSICESELAQVATVRLCGAGARTDFLNLQFDGSAVTGISGAGETIRFSVATSGGAKFLLSTGPNPANERQLRIGVIDSTGGLVFGPPQFGAVTTGDWVTLNLIDTLPVGYTVSGSATADSGQLVAVTNSGAGPFSMLTGTSSLYNGSVYLMQSFPLQVLIGGAVAFSPASGLLQLTLP